MTRRSSAPFVWLLGLLLLAAPASAGPNSQAKILLHLASVTTKSSCSPSPSLPTCSGIDVSGALYPQTYFAYLLVTDGSHDAGIAGVQWGIEYAPALQLGVDVYSWHLCATMQFASAGWPDNGSGNLVTWETLTRCQQAEPGGAGTGVTAVAGYFYCTAYSADTLRVVPRPVDDLATVVSCDVVEDTVASNTVTYTPSHLGTVVFSSAGNQPGHNPCGQ